jgi:hypothetical protein
MTGTVDIKEFFSMIKMYQIFGTMADSDTVLDPWKITMSTYRKNKKSINNVFPGFPDDRAKYIIKTMETNYLIN